MFFRPTGQMSIDVDAPNDNHEIHDHSNALDRFPAKPPVAALLDGMSLENHEVLTNRLIIDDPDNFSENYESSYRKHGTGMSSLIIHGDLSADEEPISSYLYVRPIMKIKHWFDKTEEAVPNDILFVDLLHQSVKRIFEGDKYATPITSIKVINLSIGDRSLPFYQTMSPVAKLLDWLSFKYKVLFIISTGNHCDNIQLEETYGDFKLLDNNLKEKRIYSKVIKDQRNRRLLSPSESMNNITVGSIHSDFSNYSIGEYDRRINPTERIMPSVFSAFGLGYRDSIKPDFVYLGGKQFIIEPYSDLQPADFKCDLSHQRPGNCIARPDATLSNVYYSRGTSDATALTTRNAIKIADVLMEILDEQYHLPEYSSYIPLLIKALLAHGCSWLEIEDNIHNILKDEYTGSEIKTILTKWIGYGIPNFEKALSGTEQRVTVLGFGELTIDKSHLYRFPLPPSLSSKYGKRKLTVTLAWFTPIASKTQKYKKVKLFFEQNSKLDIVRGDADRHKVRKGTLQHEIFEGVKASAFEDDDYVEIKVTCMADAQKDVTQIIPYSIAVILEVADGVDVPIYQEVRDRLITPITIESIQ